MKKKIRVISAVLLLAILLSSVAMLSSCARINATVTLAKILDNLESLDSYIARSQVNMTLYSGEVAIRSTGDSTTVESGRNDPESYFFYRESTSTVESKELGVQTSISKQEAYDGEKYYIKSSVGNKSNAICGPLETDEFFKYIYGSDVRVSGAGKVKQKENPDGSGAIECADFPKKAVNDISTFLGIGAGELGEEVSDVKLYVTYDKDYQVQKMDYIFVFDVEKEQKKYPTLRITVEYFDHNSAQDNENLVSPKGYSEWEDLEIFFKLEKLLEEKENDKKGQFKMRTEQALNVGLNKTDYVQTDTVQYGKRWGKYYFNIKSELTGVSFASQYKNGTLKTKIVGNSSEEEEISDGEAMAYIASLINNARLDITNLRSIYKLEDGEYYITYNVIDTSAYASTFATYGGKLMNCTHTVKITFDDEEIKTVESKIRMEGYHGSLMTLNTTNYFD